ncbi:MAG: porin family protein [Balneolaceae bacterium]
MYNKVGFFILTLLFFSTPAYSQLELGVSYELREEEPKSGFGVRLEKGFLNQIPIINLGMRAHFSFFNENNSVSENGVSYSERLTNYDFGAGIIAGISVGLIEPYIGLGLGSTTLDIERNEFVNVPQGFEDESNANESNIYFNGFIGSKVSIIPILKPFVEYRYSNSSLSEPEVAELTSGRIIFGVSLSF